MGEPALWAAVTETPACGHGEPGGAGRWGVVLQALKRHQSQLERALLEATARLDVLQRHERATQAALEQTRLDFGYARLEIASLNSTLESVWDEHMQREQAFKAEIASLKARVASCPLPWQ